MTLEAFGFAVSLLNSGGRSYETFLDEIQISALGETTKKADWQFYTKNFALIYHFWHFVQAQASELSFLDFLILCKSRFPPKSFITSTLVGIMKAKLLSKDST